MVLTLPTIQNGLAMAFNLFLQSFFFYFVFRTGFSARLFQKLHLGKCSFCHLKSPSDKCTHIIEINVSHMRSGGHYGSLAVRVQ